MLFNLCVDNYFPSMIGAGGIIADAMTALTISNVQFTSMQGTYGGAIYLIEFAEDFEYSVRIDSCSVLHFVDNRLHLHGVYSFEWRRN